MKELNEKTILEYIYDNLINAKYDYCYLKEITAKTNKPFPRLTGDFEYIICLKHFYIMTQRDYLNNLYKLLVDKNSLNFRSLNKILETKYKFNIQYNITDNKTLDKINRFRNNLLSHSNDNIKYSELNLEDSLLQLNKLVKAYNDVVDYLKIDLPHIDNDKLSSIKNDTKNGITMILNNETHKKIYGDNQ